MAPPGLGPVPGPQMPPGATQGPPMPQSPPVKHYELKKGVRYAVAVSIGKTQQTAMQEAADQIGEILQAQPNLMPIIGPDFFENRDFKGAKKLAKMLRKMRDQQMPFLKEDEEGQAQTPEANIRVDLLLIWPSLAVVSAWALVRVVQAMLVLVGRPP